MKNLAIINVVGLTKKLLGNSTPHLNYFFHKHWKIYLQEHFPAVTCTSQACMLTGQPPSKNGIVGNGWYFKDLAEVGFWKQNNGLIQQPKVWDILKKQNSNFSCAQLFWWYNMYANVDYSITPRPHYPADGRKIFDIYTQPDILKDNLSKKLGAFPFFNFWGPKADIQSSHWIAKSAKLIFEQYQPNLNLVYLPHLDYNLQRLGPNHPKIQQDLRKIDTIIGDLIKFYTSKKTDIMILSEYGITPTHQVIHPNRLLREHGYLKVQKSLSWELLDCGASEAFGVSDHQICHIYVKNKENIPTIVKLFQQEKGHSKILFGDAIKQHRLDHQRSGDIILMAKSYSWYSYYYWLEDIFAPDFARCIDIHRKPGYDPCELFIDPKLLFPKLKLIKTLLKKSIGMRYYMDIIPLNANLVKGSHGTPVQNREEGPLLIFNGKNNNQIMETRPITNVFNLILEYFK